MADSASRLIELAEDRLKVAEELGLSVAGIVARIYSCVEAELIDDACDLLDTLDGLINEARKRTGGSST